MTPIPQKPYSKGKSGSFFQQRLPSVFILYNPLPLAVLLLIVGLVCIAIGITEVICSSRAKSVDLRYDNINNYGFQMSDSDIYSHKFTFKGMTYSMGETTYVSFELKDSLVAPILLLYRLTNFHQNYRMYFSSKDPYQLDGRNRKIDSDCKPFKYPGEFQGDEQDGYYSPCGSIAWSFFNDSFTLYKLSESFDGSNIPSDSTLICNGAAFDASGNSLLDSNLCSKKGIAISSTQYGYKQPSTSRKHGGSVWKAGGVADSTDVYLQHGYYYEEPGHVIPDPTDEDFILWSTSAFLPDFKNVYRFINTDLEAGHYVFVITELFSYPGEKHIVLETRNFFGSSHLLVAIFTLVLGSCSFLSSLAMILLRYPFATQ